MNKIENDPLCKSVEHMIPNTALTRKRNKSEGDFYACRTCNIEKSNIDYVLGMIAKCQSNDSELSIASFQKSLDDPKRNKRFLDMFSTAEDHGHNILMKMPIESDELSKYMDFLAKGQYFKVINKPLSLIQNIVIFEIINKQVITEFEKSYDSQHNSNPLKDLQQNSYTEVIENGECLIYSKKKLEFLLFFHGGIGFVIRIVKRNRKNAKKKNEYISTFWK